MWDTYTVCAVISGILMLVGAVVVPGQEPKNRAGFALAGAVSAGYGWYVAHQTSGTYYFPVQIFLVPVIAVGYLAVSFYRSVIGQPTSAVERSRQDLAPAPTSSARPAGVPSGAPAPDAAPGWYHDPAVADGRFRRRWWDGSSWTDRTDPSESSDRALDLAALEPPRLRR